MKVDRRGKAAIITAEDFAKLTKNCKRDDRKLLLYLLRYAGERIGATCQLRVEDVYSDPAARVPSDWITFRAQTRKASPSGEQNTHQVPIHDNLRSQLMAFTPPAEGWLFPSPKNDGPINPKSIDAWFRKLMVRSGLGNKGYSLHTFRRTFATELLERGVSLAAVQTLTGHKSLKSLQEYFEVSDDMKAKAIALIA